MKRPLIEIGPTSRRNRGPDFASGARSLANPTRKTCHFGCGDGVSLNKSTIATAGPPLENLPRAGYKTVYTHPYTC